MITDKVVVPTKGGQVKVLSMEQVEELHKATIEVLENIGIKNLHDDARDIMKVNGCEVGNDKKIVKIPESVLINFLKLSVS